jgi:hypothetical protein
MRERKSWVSGNIQDAAEKPDGFQNEITYKTVRFFCRILYNYEKNHTHLKVYYWTYCGDVRQQVLMHIGKICGE